MADTTIQACLQSRLGNTKLAQNLQTTLICKTAKTSFKLYLVTVQNLERHTLDNLLALRGLLHTADQCKLKVPKIERKNSTIENDNSDDNDKPKTPKPTSETNSEQNTPAEQPTTPIAHLRLNFSSLQTQVTSLRSKNALFSKSATNNSASSSSSTKPHANFNQVIQKFDNLLKYVNSESDSDQKSSSTTTASPGNAFTSLFRKNTNTSTSSNFSSKSPVQDLLQQIDSFLDAYFTPYQRSELYARYQFKYFNQPYRSLSLADILSHDMSSIAFSDFLELEQASGILEFLYSVSAFQESFPESTEDQRQKDSMSIYLKFISMQADQKVGFGDAIRHEIETRICVEEGDCVGFDCFETAEQQALTTLNSVFFPAFRASTIYTNFLQDMLRGCRLLSNDEDKNEGLIALPDFEENSSDCSSEKINSKRFGNLSVAQQLDEDYYLRQLANPDILWQRYPRNSKNPHKKFISIGSVDSLGRFTFDNDLNKYLIKHQSQLLAKTGTSTNYRTNSGLELDDEFLENSTHVATSKMSDFQNSGRFVASFKKFVGIGSQHPAEEQDFAASMAKEFLHNLLAQNEFLS